MNSRRDVVGASRVRIIMVLIYELRRSYLHRPGHT